MKKRIVAALMAMAMTASLAACGSSGGNQTQKPADEESVSREVIENVVVEAGAKPEGWTEKDADENIVYMSNSAINTLDKWSQSAGDVTFSMDYLIFDGLANKDDDGNIIPWLATDWEMAEDASEITFHLRDDVYFSNGDHFTAADAVFSFERLRDDTEHLPDATVKSWRNYLGDIEQTNDYTFTIHFTMPMPEFWSLVATPDVQIVSKAAFESTDYNEFWEHPVGTGPYVVTSMDGANSVVELELRSDEHGYWAYAANGTYTNVKTIKYQYSPEDTTRVSSLRTGEADVIANIPTTEVQGLSAEGFYVQEVPVTNEVFLQLASGEENIFNNRDLRKAFSLCIDREAIIDALLDGYAIAANYPAVEGDLGYRNDISYEYNIEKATELVKNSGYNGEEIKFIYTTSTVAIGSELVPAIQSMGEQIGLNISVEPLEVAVYDEARANREFDICLASIGKSGSMWYKAAAEVVGNDRFNTGFTNQEEKDLGLELAVTVDQEKQDELLAELYELELSNFEPNLYLYFPVNITVWNSNLAGISYHDGKIIDLSTVVVVK